MNHQIVYKIQNAYMLPYAKVIDKKIMDTYDKTNEIIASSKIYLICKIQTKPTLKGSIPKPQVLYVGETFHKKKRFSTHEKLLKATTMLEPDEMLAVYFLQLKLSFLGSSPFIKNLHDSLKDISNIHAKPSVQVMERLFIKLFNPILNGSHNNNKVVEDKLFQQRLISNDIRFAILDVGMNDDVFNFVGGRRCEGTDWYRFDLKYNNLT